MGGDLVGSVAACAAPERGDLCATRVERIGIGSDPPHPGGGETGVLGPSSRR